MSAAMSTEHGRKTRCGIVAKIDRREGKSLAYHCEICNKKTSHGFNVSHSNRHTKRVWKPNIQRVRARVDGKVKRIYVCTACLKSGRVDRAI